MNTTTVTAYLRDALVCLEEAARGDEFQIATARYKVEEALHYLGADRPGGVGATLNGERWRVTDGSGAAVSLSREEWERVNSTIHEHYHGED